MGTGRESLNTYVVVTTKDWNVRNFYKIAREVKADWHLITNREDLTFAKIRPLNPKYIFFPHWSWIIPKKVYSNFECVVFHMTDLPYGRGGSPLQNLIARGICETRISAIKVTGELDAGPIYLKENLCLHGNAEEIFIRASDTAFNMIRNIAKTRPSPVEQKGERVIFKRRTPAEGRIPAVPDLKKVFDWIRMLDAEGYPKAFIETENLRLEFSRASLKDGHIVADAKIMLRIEELE